MDSGVILEDPIATLKKKNEDKVILSLEERGFCVSLKEGGTIQKESRDLNELIEQISISSVSWIDYVADNLNADALKIATQLGFSEQLLSSLLKNERGAYEDLDNEIGLLIPAIIVEGLDVKINYLLILMREGLVATIHTTRVKRFFRLRRYAKIFMKKIKQNSLPQDKITQLLIRILDENNSRNFDHLREIEENADRISERLSDINLPRSGLNKDIHMMKHALITYLNALWETIDVFNTLRYGDPELLSDDPKILQRVGALALEVNTHIGLAEHMSEVLASGLEVMQSVYNNQLQILNNKMALLVAYLTVIGTAVLVPNTLATALSSPVFSLTPDDKWWYVSLLVFSTIISTLGAYIWVKKTGLLPEKTE